MLYGPEGDDRRWAHTHLAPYRDPSVVKLDTHMQALQSKQAVFVNLSCKRQTTCFLTAFSVPFSFSFRLALCLSNTAAEQLKQDEQQSLDCGVELQVGDAAAVSLTTPESTLRSLTYNSEDCVSSAEKSGRNTQCWKDDI